MAKTANKSQNALAALTALTSSPKEAKSKKSTMPEMRLDAKKQGFVKQWLDASRTIKDAEAAKAAAEDELMSPVELERRRLSLKEGAVQQSIRVLGDPVTEADPTTGIDRTLTPSLRVTQANRWLQMDADVVEADLKHRFPAKFDAYFKTNRALVIDAVALNERPEVMQKVFDALKALGPDVGNIAEMKSTIVPTETFFNTVYTDAETQKAWDELQNSGKCKLAKASFCIK